MHRKRLFCLLACASLIALLAIPRAASAQTLLSQGKPATASSVEGAFVAANAVDGNTGTRWGSAFSDPQWLQVDLGGTAAVSAGVLAWWLARAYSARVLQLDVAPDPRTALPLVLVAAALTAAVGLAGSYRALQAKPMDVLRGD